MTGEGFEAYLSERGLRVERLTGADGNPYTVVRAVRITLGGLAGRTCDVAVAYTASIPYVPPAAVHTCPAMLPMQPGEPFGAQASGIGEDWQYLSRRYDRIPTPEGLWTHILTVLSDDRWPST